MRISYELNPPKILEYDVFSIKPLKERLERFYSRVVTLKDIAYAIHVTDSVLGIPRLSSVSIASTIVNEYKHRARCSIRVRDRNMNAIMQLVTDAILAGIDGILVIKGDEPKHKSTDSGLSASSVVRILNNYGFNKHVKLYLSIGCDASESELSRKLSAEPYGLITQSIASIESLEYIADTVKSNNKHIVPCIMVPSIKNKASADTINLNWSNYENNIVEFIKKAHNICGEVMLTSPNSFNEGVETMKMVKGVKINDKR
jgi:5,10-methylenetetrahydrofolate reductase